MSFRTLCVLLISVVSSVSCIYENAGDPYYRTLWMCDDPEFGIISVDFLCDNMMAVKASNAEFDDYGYYSTDGKAAYFDDLSIIVADMTAVFVEAHRNGDELQLVWLSEKDSRSVTMNLRRLTSYDMLPK